jgi:hypothetical protein
VPRGRIALTRSYGFDERIEGATDEPIGDDLERIRSAFLASWPDGVSD